MSSKSLRSYLTGGILCFGCGRARCASCGQGFVVACSCKGRGVCPSCNASDRRSITTCISMHARPTASSCRPVTGRRPSCGQAACRRQLPARPITLADLAALTEKVRRLPPAGHPPTGASSFRPTFDRAIIQATDRRAARERHPQPLTAFHATVRTARKKSGFKAGLRRRDQSGLERRQEPPRHLHDRAASSPIGSGCCSS